MEREFNWQTGEASVVMKEWFQTVVVKKGTEPAAFEPCDPEIKALNTSRRNEFFLKGGWAQQHTG